MQNSKWAIAARKKLAVDSAGEGSDGDEVVVKKKKKTSKTSKRTRKKAVAETPEESSDLEVTSDGESVETAVSAAGKDTKRSPWRTREKGSILTSFYIPTAHNP